MLREHVVFQESAANATSLTTMVSPSSARRMRNAPCGTYSVNGVGARADRIHQLSSNLGTTPANHGGRYDGPACFMGASNVRRAWQGSRPWSPWRASPTAQPTRRSGARWFEDGTGPRRPNTIGLPHGIAPAEHRGLRPLETYLHACQNTTTLAGFDHKGQVWGSDFGGLKGGYSHIMTPNRNACLFESQSLPAEYSAMCVGAVRFIRGA